MKNKLFHYTFEDNNPINSEIWLTYNLKGCETNLIISAGPLYQIFLDDKIISYGPERTAEGYTRLREIALTKEYKKISIRIISYGIPSYDVDFQKPFVNISLFDKNNNVIATTRDFECFKTSTHEQYSTKFSYQRGFVERFNFNQEEITNIKLIDGEEKIILPSMGDTCKYLTRTLKERNRGDFKGFSDVAGRWFMANPYTKKYCVFDIDKYFLEEVKNDYKEINYTLENETTSIIEFAFESKTEQNIFIVFDEYVVNDEWIYGRGCINNVIMIKATPGKHKLISASPYSFKDLKVIYHDEISCTIKLIAIENNLVDTKENIEKAKKDPIFAAAFNTFKQNSIDLFTDCPTREKAGWLCDSYFSGFAEYALLGKNQIERNFLENIILSKTPEIDEGMLPMCFPSEHFDNNYLPNWAMWFVLEVEQYFNRTKDSNLIGKAKKRIYDVLDFFKKYENEYGLLEDLPKWVFIEWSEASSNDYLKGVSFLSNMSYARMMEAAGNLYNDKKLIERSNKLKKEIFKWSYHNDLFCDNATRNENGELVVCLNHTSETAQYYAIFMGINSDKKFIERIIDDLSVDNRKLDIPKSAVFIGYFLRLFILKKQGLKDKLMNEINYLYKNMATRTGTIWEKDTPDASCNHGFASVLIYLMQD